MNRQSHWAVRARQSLIDELGGECSFCGTKFDLEINHIYGRTWKAREKSSWQRIAIYKREAKLGLLNVLCGCCNKQYRPIVKPKTIKLPKEKLPF
jgi:hypothetical protein